VKIYVNGTQIGVNSFRAGGIFSAPINPEAARGLRQSSRC